MFKRATNDRSVAPKAEPKPGLRARLSKSRNVLARGIGALIGGGAKLDEGIFEDLEDFLISADVGVEAGHRIVASVREAATVERVTTAAEVLDTMRREMLEILRPCARQPRFDQQPHVVLVVGVNGVGKTTTIAKIAKRLTDDGRSVMLAAGDTFRAAAVEQLQTWGDRLGIPVIAQGHGADAAAVAHDALESARARDIDVLIVDTAGRQHTQGDLMEQLIKIKRVIGKQLPEAPHDVLQVLDAATGQNALSQLQHFNAAVAVTGLCLTKLDGTAKGGVLLALAAKFGVPIHYIGVGEGFDDLREFDPDQFVDALLPAEIDN